MWGGGKKSKKGDVTDAYSFDPTGLERAAKAAKELNENPHADKALELANQQETTKQLEAQQAISANNAAGKQADIERIRVSEEERRKTIEADNQNKAQLAQYNDQLARKRYEDQMALHERSQQQELARQEQSAQRVEALRRKTVEYEAQLRRQTDEARVAAEVAGTIRQERENHDLKMQKARLEAEEYRETVLKAIGAAGETLGNGVQSFLTDPSKLTGAAATVTAMAVGIYAARTSIGIAGRYVESQLGKPSLVRETSRSRSSLPSWQSVKRTLGLGDGAGADALSGVVLKKPLAARLRSIATSTSNTKAHRAPFQHLMLHGPPGTGKTLFAKSLARSSGLDYAILTGGDVAPLGREGVTELHRVFDWASTSRRGLLLFVDEADAFLRKRGGDDGSGGGGMSEDLRNALNAFLYRTGEQSSDFMLVLATNQPEQLDWAVSDRMDEMVHFDLPSQRERLHMLRLYFDKYIVHPPKLGWWRSSKPIEASGMGEAELALVAEVTTGFSGREIAKLCLAWQAAAYGTADRTLTAALAAEVTAARVQQHQRKERWGAAERNLEASETDNAAPDVGFGGEDSKQE